MTKPITTLTRASHPPLLGKRFKYDGNKARKKNGRARPLEKHTMPSSGRAPPPCTEAASSDPTNGPTQANDVSENVSPMSSVPNTPPFCEARSSDVRMPEGMVISNAPSRLSPKIRNTSEIKPFTHGL